MKGQTQLSIQPVTVQISQSVSPIGAITTTPVRKFALSRARIPRRRGGAG